jgi:hypothetical protein
MDNGSMELQQWWGTKKIEIGRTFEACKKINAKHH